MVNMAVGDYRGVNKGGVKAELGIEPVSLIAMALKQAAVNNYPFSIRLYQVH